MSSQRTVTYKVVDTDHGLTMVRTEIRTTETETDGLVIGFDSESNSWPRVPEGVPADRPITWVGGASRL